jgi:hypothetical protein
MRTLLLLLIFFSTVSSFAQMTDRVFQPNIRSVKLHVQNNQTGYPIIRLNSSDQLSFILMICKQILNTTLIHLFFAMKIGPRPC